jgi:NifU-like protein involved in Fe-S cluster formation
MNYYSKQIIDVFNDIKHNYSLDVKYNFIGNAGDIKIGEYITLYIDIDPHADILSSKIIKATFSAIGSVMLLATAEYLCSMIECITLQEALFVVDPDNDNGLYALDILETREHSFGFVLQAFYDAVENINNSAISSTSVGKI